TCTILLPIVSSTLLIAEFYAHRTFLSHEIKTLASSLASNSSRAIVLGRYPEVEEVLASLRLQKNIHAAYMFDSEGKPIAEYLNQQNFELLLTSIEADFKSINDQFWTSATEKQIVSLAHFSFFFPVVHQGKTVGFLYLLSDLTSFYVRLNGVIFGIAISFLLLLFCSWFIARWIQKPISAPLIQLAAVMETVSDKQDYSVRAEKVSIDEVGVLVDGFNRMLGQIEQQQKQLTRHQRQLEKAVTERTTALRVKVAQLDKARHEANAANAAKSDFLSKMTHELRTPLIGVLGMNELLQRTQLDEQQLMLTGTVQRSGEELLRLINDVLDMSRIEAGKLSLEPIAVELYRVVEEVAYLLSPQTREKGLELIVDIPLSATWKVRADEGRIRQILMNLIANAVKFTDAGEVSISLKSVKKAGGMGAFTFYVSDRGPGMDDEVKSQIFDVFYQADSGDTRECRGAGLGLAIVKQLVDLMDGELTLKSIPGRGSNFQVSFIFPLVEKVDFALPAELQNQSVLLCVSDASSAALLCARLDELSLSVDVAHSGSDALYYLRAAQQSGRTYEFMLLGDDVALAEDQLMYQVLRKDPALRPVRMLLISSDQSKEVNLSPDEVRLSLPLSWAAFHTAIIHSWQSLYLVCNQSASTNIQPKSTQGYSSAD
ncbi:MAG: ATP-binding protein, partial [Deltaproteobacteria bacterium]|nr:ATP-binding protein [Deltaproteobacteria bacterium]